LNNCTVISNRAELAGGGVANATLHACKVADNLSNEIGGCAYLGALYDCVISNNVAAGDGGGAWGATLERCTLVGNACGDARGGGAYYSKLHDCIVYGNRANRSGGGLAICVSRNCTIYGNVCNGSGGGTCTWGAWRDGDGPSVGTNFNCIVYGNTASYDNDIAPNVPSFNCCTNDPHFIRAEAGDFRLRYDSPCIDAGDNAYVTTVVDCAGNPRIVGGTVDIGAYEYAGGGDEPEGYLVVDLSGGVNATNYPVSYLASVPTGGWTDEYKTSKLVLRAIAPGTFTMGSPEDENGRRTNEAPHQVTLTHSYYIGVFELTQRQWELVMGDRPSAFSNTVAYAARPVERVSFNQIRGAELGSYWPQMNTVDETSFMGRLRAKTGRLFDLPTEAQWEYACRAGTTTAFNSGKNIVAGVDANMAEVGRYYYNSGAYNNSWDRNGTDETGTAKLGSYLPNAWGLYDMHGNVGEFCLDWYPNENLSAATDPVGLETGSGRYLRGGTWGNYSDHNRSATRNSAMAPSTVSFQRGFRPVVNFSDFSLKKVVNVQASDGAEPGVLVTWTAVPGAEQYVIYRGLTPAYRDAVGIDRTTNTSYLNQVASTNVYWYWVRAIVDGTWCALSDPDSGYRPQFQLTVANGTGSTNCFANTSVSITANAAKTGYTFKEWTGTAADVALLANKSAASTTFKIPGRAVTLTATYQPNVYSVEYVANKGEGTMANESFTYDAAKALTANAFTRTGYTYQGWATTAAGNKVYADKQTVSNLTATANGVVNLYAVWTANAYTVKFNANGGTGTMSNESFTYDVAKALTANAFSRTGYTYQGWATTAAGAKAYSNQQTVSNLTATANGTVNLYAVWTANPYTVTFDANGGEGAAMAAQNFAYGTAQKLSNVGYTKTGYTFVGWSADKNATSATYANGASVSNLATSGTKTLYAVWRANVYAIRFLPNGADGTMADEAAAFDTVTNLTANAFTKTGYGFIGWCAEGETTVSYTNRQEVVNLATNDGAVVTLVAKWTDKWYVDAVTGNDANEGTSSELAFKTIQHAINHAEAGQTIIVADGTYAPINTANKSIIIQSVNGAAKTIIDGGGTNRCAYLSAWSSAESMTNTVLCGFRLQNGYSTLDAGGVQGGSLWDCFIVSNRAVRSGGGAYASTIHSSVLTDNQCSIDQEGYGGGAYLCQLDNCLVAGNRTGKSTAAGVSLSTCRNCTIYGNAGMGAHAWLVDGLPGGTNYNCIVYGNTGTTQIDSRIATFNCFTRNPLFVDAEHGDFRLQGASPCIDMGNNKYVVGETDLRGNARIQNDVVDLGAYEYTLPRELGNVPVEGTDVAVPVEWLGAYGYVDEDATPATLQKIMAQAGDNGVPLWKSWVAGLDPWDPVSQFEASIKIVDGEARVTWTPDLSKAEPKRYYTTMGKTNLTDSAWVLPKNDAHRFFKVTVTMGEPGLAKEVAATAGTSAEGVTISWHAVDLAIGYNVYRSTIDDFAYASQVATVAGTEYTDVAAVPGTLYYYWIVSVANGGEWQTSENASGYRKLGVPQHVAASDGTSSGWITVTWDAVAGASSYRVFRATTAAEEDAVEVGTSTGTSWMDQNAACGVTYHYWVAAVGANFTGEMSSSDVGYLRLAAPTGVTASNGAFADRVDVAWNNVEGATHYRVYRGSSASGSKTAVSGWQTGLTYSDTSAASGVTYYYFVTAAADGEGANASGYSTGVVGGLQIGAPMGVYASDGTSSTGVMVSWTGVAGADGYSVYRGTSGDPAAAQVLVSTANATITDTTAAPGTLYYYWVVATNAVSVSAKSAGDAGFRALPAPAKVTATNVSGATAVTVSWQAVEGALSYRIYRGTKSGETYAVEIDTTTETSYADEGGAANKTYYYSVKAVGASCESGFSAFVAGNR